MHTGIIKSSSAVSQPRFHIFRNIEVFQHGIHWDVFSGNSDENHRVRGKSEYKNEK